tara:strand:+ start:78 stop:1316 length:1239 start_codon:yes stop_codon:yes gene_type:complete
MISVPTGLTSLADLKKIPLNKAGIFSARVVKTILNNNDEETALAFKENGEWSSIGSILFNSITQPNLAPNVLTNQIAKPLFPAISAVPLLNEIVYILFLPDANIQENVNSGTYYYFQSINIWNSTHHNAIPDPYKNDTIPESQRQDYQQTETGNVRRVTDGSTEIELGDTFQERLDIRNLLPYEGDYIYQGRWGNTIRFGSTVTDAPIPNPWSSVGENGDPITIIKNGQHEEDTDPWEPQVEDINTDLSSIYLTSTQALPIDVSSKSYNSYFNAPTATNEFDSEQVVINSGRILFNSKDDNILLSSFDTINLNSINSVNIDTPKTIVQSREIYLGDKYATEPVILGDKFLDDFKGLCSNIVQLCTALSVPIAEYPPTKAVAPLPIKASTLRNQAQRMISNIDRYKSKVSKSK